jgi:hypothetical protein
MRRLAEDRRGAAMVEFAFAVPLLMLFGLGFADVVQLGRGHHRAQSAATQIGQVVSQCRRVSGGDEVELTALTKRILGPFAATGKQWALVITAEGRDSQDKPFTWRMQSREPASYAVNAQGVRLQPDPNQPGLTINPDEVLYRTEVFVTVETSFFSKDNPVIKNLLGSGRDGRAYGSALHMTRAPDASGLRSQNTADNAEDCLKAR